MPIRRLAVVGGMSSRTSAVCMECGACCAAYRVSFYWSEALALPPALTQKVNPWLSCMAGTNQPAPRCHALQGEIGQRVSCGVYEQRSSTCRELVAGDDRCGRARLRHGLAPLQPGAT